MGSRKRRYSQLSESQRSRGKRAKLFPHSWSSEQSSASVDESLSCSIESSSSVYQIKAIIGERGDEYLVDWADDPNTGESFEPDWVSRTDCS